jgi:hypothetical protein
MTQLALFISQLNEFEISFSNIIKFNLPTKLSDLKEDF